MLLACAAGVLPEGGFPSPSPATVFFKLAVGFGLVATLTFLRPVLASRNFGNL